MPNVWSHILFGKRVRARAGQSEPRDWHPFNLGCQGPDSLLYHNFWPWKRDDSVRRLGSAIHRRHCGPFLLDLIRAAADVPDMREYVAGFLTHHILDRKTHPYIIYRSGNGKYKHQKLEVIIDTLLAERLAGWKTWKTPVVPLIDVGRTLPREWAEVLHGTARKHFPEETAAVLPGHWDEAYRHMKRALRIFYDPCGVKWFLTLGKIGPFRYRPVRSETDYLNESKREWLHPAVPEEAHRESFMELWEVAVEEGADLLGTTCRLWEGEGSWTALCRGIGNLSYDTGKECGANLKNRVAAPLV
ncbi:hypothetical protein C8P63_12718 [Melghirimyces profundicolus]|uniref:Zinc dependent phospholipase C n=1 Tax=Melghirimyces profundicolus TaxID=1242148 RepID=A0A2T6BC96_9BACL|nr:hypothetical protein [Melghirimyces profundicolus]PTX53698.1 hypothetical protein C8P63_12718 [Melghirimyces profundicolus]